MADTAKESWDRALEDAFGEHYKFLYRAAKSVVRHKQDAEDVVQNLFLKLSGSEFHPEIRTNPKAYLRRAVINDSLNFIRSRKSRKEDNGVEKLEIAAAGTGRADDNVRDKLDDAFASLGEDVREMVTLHCQHGYSDSEIAQMLGHSRSKVAMTLSRSRARLHERSECKPDRAQPSGR